MAGEPAPKAARKKKGNAALLVGALVVLGLAVGFGTLVVKAQSLPQGPEPVAWDKAACAHCRMHVSEPGFAAQLQLKDGRVLNFDDPGCYFQYVAAGPADPVHAVYFHHLKEERWLTRAEVGFLPNQQTPMGFGLGAVESGTPGALPFEAARAHVLRGKAQGAPGARP